MGSKDKLKVIISKIGLDTHTTGARLISRILRDAGMEVVYLGKYQTPEMIVKSAIQEDADVIGVSCLASSYGLIIDLMNLVKEKKLKNLLVVVGGTIPNEHVERLKAAGVGEVFTPNSSLDVIVEYIRTHARKVPA